MVKLKDWLAPMGLTEEQFLTLQDEAHEIYRSAGFDAGAEERIDTALKILLAGHNLTLVQFRDAVWSRILTEHPYPVTLLFRNPQEQKIFLEKVVDTLDDTAELIYPYEAGVRFDQNVFFGVDVFEEEDADR